MVAAPAETFHARKARLRTAFCAQLPTRIAEAHAHLQAAHADPAQTDRALQHLELTLHTLKGSSGSFGLTAVAALAHEADDLVKQALAAGTGLTPALHTTLIGLLERLAEAPRAAAGAAPGERFSFEPLPAAADPAPHSDQASDLQAPVQTPPPAVEPAVAAGAQPDTTPTPRAAASTSTQRRERRVYLCDDDADLAAQLCAQLTCFGYRASALTSLAELRQAMREAPPDALIMDIMFPEGADAGAAMLADINDANGHAVPTIFISCRDDFAARLHAVKAGGDAYCTKPVKITEIVEFLDNLTNREHPLPFHILVVDDDPQIATLHALILEEAGMITATATAPEAVPELLESFNADLVLMDMYMPGCSGPQLARVLRQMPGHLSLPIIYLSSETDQARQLEAMEVGADGFLTKPVAAHRLVAEVSLRAERMRALHALMVRDGLTGLFNHNTIMQFLELGVANAQRDRRPLCFAMLDVDRFKQVNDRYGHPAGDQVLMALSRGLRLRLRECDVVGRYGGEEFAVVLIGVDTPQAKDILDQLRINFSQVQFYADEEHFNCTFSAGIAGLTPDASADGLIEAADRALYQAKAGGRNRIEIAPAPAAAAHADPEAGARPTTPGPSQ